MKPWQRSGESLSYCKLNVLFLRKISNLQSHNACQSNCTVPKVSYHNLASPIRVKQNLLTFWSSGKLCVSIQLLVLRRCSSASSSGFPENSGLKYDQFNCSGCAIAASKFWNWFGGWLGWLGWIGWIWLFKLLWLRGQVWFCYLMLLIFIFSHWQILGLIRRI